MTRCMNKLAIVPATTLRGAIVAILAQVSGADKQMASILMDTIRDRTRESRVRRLMISAVAGGATNDTALACGHGQMRRVGSADAFQRRGAGRLRNYEIGVRQADWRALSVHNGVLQESLTSGSPGEQRNVACGDKSGLVAVSLELIADLDCGSSAKSVRHSRRGGVRIFSCLVVKPSGGNS